MKIISVQGNFGNLCGKRIDFKESMTVSVLPNGWGKTTLCAFLRVMFYGLNTAKRDTQAALSDKTRYVPHDGKPMYGRLTVQYDGRTIVIIRATGRAGPMQDFDAYDEQTGEPCDWLTAKNCGEVLLGAGEDGFLSSVFIEGAAMTRSSEELRERMLQMAQTGDTQGRAAEALATLSRWRLDLDSGNGYGEIPRAAERLEQSRQALLHLTQSEEEMARERARVASLAQEEAQAQERYERVYRAFAAESTGHDERLVALIAESQGLIDMLKKRIPPERQLRAAADALYGYEGASRLEREKRERLPSGGNRYKQALEELEEERRTYEIEMNRAKEPRIRWVPLVLALLLAVASAGTYLLNVEWGAYTQFVPWVLSGMAVIGLAAAFVGRTKRVRPPVRDFEEERKALARRFDRESSEQDTASQVLQDAYDALLSTAGAIRPAVVTVEQAQETIRAALSDEQALRREQAALGELMEQRKQAPAGVEEKRGEVEELRWALAAARGRADAARQTLAQMEGRTQTLGNRDMVRQEIARFEQVCAQAEKRRAAVLLAAEEIKGAQAELSARISPQITALAQEHLRFLTDGAYCEVQLDTALRARCAAEDGRLLDTMCLSAGTRDQLYFALRLALSEVLCVAKEPAPLLLDDPFITFDDRHTARAMELLRRMARTRQVILFTGRSLQTAQNEG